MRYNEGDQVVFKYLNKKMFGTVLSVKYSRKDKCFYHSVRAENLSIHERLRVDPDGKTERLVAILAHETDLINKVKSTKIPIV